MFSQVFIKGWTGLCLRVDMPSLSIWIISVTFKTHYCNQVKLLHPHTKICPHSPCNECLSGKGTAEMLEPAESLTLTPEGHCTNLTSLSTLGHRLNGAGNLGLVWGLWVKGKDVLVEWYETVQCVSKSNYWCPHKSRYTEGVPEWLRQLSTQLLMSTWNVISGL